MGSRRVIVRPGQVWVISRRTTRRHFLLTPDQQRSVERIVLYLLGYYCDKFGVLLHAVVVMSNHIHYIITDRRGVRPRFKEEFHRVLANCLKAHLGWPEEVWNKSKTGEHEPLNAEALVEQCGYVIANPPLAGAVRYSRDWPGLKTSPADLGRRVERVERPTAYLRDAELWPEHVDVRFEMPAMLEAEYGAVEARKRVAASVRRHEAVALAESRRTGRPFLGPRRVLRQKHTERARSYEAFQSLNPRWAAAGDREAAAAKKAELLQWNADYDQALALWTSGKRSRALFPNGTWWMRVHHGARVRAPP
jgi:putative transposase